MRIIEVDEEVEVTKYDKKTGKSYLDLELRLVQRELTEDEWWEHKFARYERAQRTMHEIYKLKLREQLKEGRS